MACCEKEISKAELQLVEFSKLMGDRFSDLICDAENFECFGQAPEALETYDKMNELWYFFFYSFLVGLEANNRIKNAQALAGINCIDSLGILKPMYAEYSLDCMLDFLQCRHRIDGQDILDIFDIRRDIRKGIDWMTIENTDPCKAPFKIE